jgi:methionyl-tRNA synthetase
LWNGTKVISDLYDRFRFRDAITETMNVARAANKYFNDEEPWKTAKTSMDECAKSIYICCQLVRSLAVLFAPIVPFAVKRIFDILNLDPQIGDQNYGKPTENYWIDAALPLLPAGSEIKNPELLFPRVEDEIVEAQVAKLGDKQQKKEEVEEVKPELITIDDFMKVKLRTATILEAENVKKSKKLIKLKVDLGNETRQILAGIAEHYKPEELVGRTIVVVANLQPAKLMGLESQGMLLAANTGDGKLAFVTPEKNGIPPGAEVR